MRIFMSLVGVGLLVLWMPGPAYSQQPGSAAYNSVYLPAHGVGDTRRQGVENWGAFASGVGDVVGWTMDGATEDEAEQIAMSECQSSGGTACRIEGTFVNECAVLASGPSDYGWSHGNRGMRFHRKRALAQCGAGCRIIREGCTGR